MKIVWNYFYTMYYGGNGHYRADLMWISRHGLDRAVEVDSWFKHYDGQHPRFREPDADKELLTQMFAEVRAPADVNGILSLVLALPQRRQRDSNLDLRAGACAACARCRRPTARTVSRLRSHAGRRRVLRRQGAGLHWKLVGEQDMLVVRQAVVHRSAQLERLPEAVGAMEIPGGARVGFPGSGLDGVALVPVQSCCAARTGWSSGPKDPYYLIGKLVSASTRRCSWQLHLEVRLGRARGSDRTRRFGTNIVKAAPGELWGWARLRRDGAHWKLDRATTAGIVAARTCRRLPHPAVTQHVLVAAA
jgi:hypothetical protein